LGPKFPHTPRQQESGTSLLKHKGIVFFVQ
jgi:hypothetical protein